MNLKYVVPDMEKTFGELEFAGEGEVEQRRVNGRQTVVNRTYNLFSTIQKADNVTVVLPGLIGEKHFDFEEKVKIVNPRIVADGYNINGRGFTEYKLIADDMVKA